MTAFQPDQWHDLFVAVAGASAALAGLIFVAVSINLARILELDTVPTGAAETLSIMIGVLVLSVFALVPGQSHQALGAEALVLGLGGGAFLMVRRLRLPRKEDDPSRWTVVPVAASLPAPGSCLSRSCASDLPDLPHASRQRDHSRPRQRSADRDDAVRRATRHHAG